MYVKLHIFFELQKELKIQLAQVDLTILLLEFIKPTLRRLVRPTNPQSFAKVLKASTKAEQDKADCTLHKPTPAKEEAPRKAAVELVNSKCQQAPAYRFYPKYYFHRDCIVL